MELATKLHYDTALRKSVVIKWAYHLSIDAGKSVEEWFLTELSKVTLKEWEAFWILESQLEQPRRDYYTYSVGVLDTLVKKRT